MRLQYKAWALVLATVGVLTLIAVLVSGLTISRSFSGLERERAELDGERALRLLAQQIDGLATTLGDYAYWSDTVEFVAGHKPGYVEQNFSADNLKALRVSGVLLLSSSGQTVSSATQMPETLLPPAQFDVLRRLARPVLADPQGRTVVRSYETIDGGLFLVAVAPVRVHSAPGAKPEGALAMVRRLDADELNRFADVLMQPVRLSLEEPDHAGPAFHLDLVSDALAEAHVVVNSAEGQTVAELVLGVDRRLQQQGRSLAWAAGGQVAVTGLLLGALLVLLLDRFLLRRLQTMHKDLQLITGQGTSAERQVRVQGKDELSAVAQGLNALLRRVHQDGIDQQAAFERQEGLQQQLLQSQKMEALGRFTGGIAHDFNNSLAAITGWMRLADEDLDKAHPSHEALQHALKATRYADGLMRQLLAFSRQSPPRIERFRLSRLIEESRSLIASGLTKRSRLEVAVQTQNDWVDADPTQMQQVLVNLLMNASDAMGGEGTIWLRLTAQTWPQPAGVHAPRGLTGLAPGRYLVLTVQDEGPGIRPEHLDRIFDPFFTTKTVGRGTGLGLSVAHGILARHAGGIGVNSPPGSGACFSVYVPGAEGAESMPAALAETVPRSTRRILFVDDDQMVRHAWSALLERRGWQVTRARDGEEAWTLFRESIEPFDLVLTDLSMPRLDGVGLARRIRESEAPPPIVLMSGNVSVEDAALLRRDNFAAVLHKPVEAPELERVLRELTGPGAPG